MSRTFKRRTLLPGEFTADAVRHLLGEPDIPQFLEHVVDQSLPK